MIEIESLTYRYNKKKSLFNGLNLTLLPGKVYGLLGKNGAGKSSLIKNIAGMLFPTSGRCLVYSRQPQQRETRLLEQLFFVPEECDLPPLSIAAFIDLYAPFYPLFNRAQFSGYLRQFNVDESGHTKQLSFGQKKKTFIAFALAANTRVLIMDEPTNGLDIPSKSEFRNIVAGIDGTEKITIISTHQVRDLDDLINAIILLDQGELLFCADKEAVQQKLFFSKNGGLHGQAAIYVEQTPQGPVSITLNEEGRDSYLDLEVLFNAALANKTVLRDILNSPSHRL